MLILLEVNYLLDIVCFNKFYNYNYKYFIKYFTKYFTIIKYIMKVFLVKFASSLLILMFIVSGFRKVITLGKSEGKRFSEKLNNFNIILSINK